MSTNIYWYVFKIKLQDNMSRQVYGNIQAISIHGRKLIGSYLFLCTEMTGRWPLSGRYTLLCNLLW